MRRNLVQIVFRCLQKPVAWLISCLPRVLVVLGIINSQTLTTRDHTQKGACIPHSVRCSGYAAAASTQEGSNVVPFRQGRRRCKETGTWPSTLWSVWRPAGHIEVFPDVWRSRSTVINCRLANLHIRCSTEAATFVNCDVTHKCQVESVFFCRVAQVLNLLESDGTNDGSI